MRRVVIGAWVSLFFIQSSFAVGEFTLTSEEMQTYINRCGSSLRRSVLEGESKYFLEMARLSWRPPPVPKPTLESIIESTKQGKLKKLIKPEESKPTEYTDLDGLVFRNMHAADLEVVDTLTKQLDSQKLLYKDNYITKKTVVGNTTYLRRSCVSSLCSERKQQQSSLVYAKQPTVCNDALCAIKQIYGEEKGLLILYTYLKYKLNVAPKVDINADPEGFDTETLTALLIAADAIPKHLYERVFSKQQFFRFSKGRTLAFYGANNNVVANALGAIFDAIDNFSFNEKVYVFLHEMGHRAAYQKGSADNLDITSEWITASRSGDPISEYSLKNKEENFAETFVLYRLDPDKLARASAQRYSYMKTKVFNGIEYRIELCGK